MHYEKGPGYDLHHLKIDKEFEQLHIPMSDVKLKRLELNIVQRGATRPIIVWNGYIVDGHKRYLIYHRRKIPFEITDIALVNRCDVMEWICDRNLQIPDLTEEYKKYFIGKKLLIRVQAFGEKSEMIGLNRLYGRHSYRKSAFATQIGNSLNMSYTTILKYAQYAEAIDAINKYEPAISSRILMGQVKVSHSNVITVSELSQDEMRVLRDCFTDGKYSKVTSSQIWHELQWSCVHPSVPVKKKDEQPKAEIKKMPKYDPDAELQSLSLTIPMWKSSVERVRNNADFECASEGVKSKLLVQLTSLADAIYDLSSFIKEGLYSE